VATGLTKQEDVSPRLQHRNKRIPPNFGGIFSYVAHCSILYDSNMPENFNENEAKDTREIAKTITEIPELKEDYVRLVHLTAPEAAEKILAEGLDYKKQGMAMSMARSWSKEDEVEYGSADSRFSQPGTKAVVFDISNDEWKLHNRLGNAPGVISPEKVVGVVDAETKQR